MTKKQLINSNIVVKTIIKKKPIIMIVLFLLLVGLLSVVVYFFKQHKIVSPLLKTKTQAATEDIKTIVTKVGALYELPKGEEPTLATVTDKRKLIDQAFFARAENGDKMLIYTNAKKIILYRPSINKIIEVAPINIAEPQKPSPTSVSMVKVAIYNGTKKNGYGSETAAKLKSAINNIDIVQTANTKKDYDKNLVIDFTGKLSNDVQNIITQLGSGEVAASAEGEIKPDADILVILGK